MSAFGKSEGSSQSNCLIWQSVSWKRLNFQHLEAIHAEPQSSTKSIKDITQEIRVRKATAQQPLINLPFFTYLTQSTKSIFKILKKSLSQMQFPPTQHMFSLVTEQFIVAFRGG